MVIFCAAADMEEVILSDVTKKIGADRMRALIEEYVGFWNYSR